MISKTIKTYNRYHQIYDNETIDFWEQYPQTVLKEFAKNLPGNKILDLGSGPGRDALLLKNLGLEITCVDLSQEMIKRTTKLGFKSIKKDIRKLNFPNQSFDGVWAFTSLLHISKPEAKKVIESIYKILKPNGMFLIGMIEGSFSGDVVRETMPNEKRYFRFYSDDELRTMVESNGFKFVFQNKYSPHSKTYLSQIYSVRK